MVSPGAAFTGTHGTMVLTRSEIAALMDPAAYLDAVEKGFHAGARGEAWAPAPLSVPGKVTKSPCLEYAGVRYSTP